MSEFNRNSSRGRTSNTGGRRTAPSRTGRSGSSHSSSRNHSGHSGYGKSNYSYSARNMHNRRRRRNRDITQWIVYGVALAVVILAVVLLFKGCKGGGDALESTEESIAGEAADGGITVDGISIDGMSQEEAREAILEQYGWDMKVTYKDKTASVNNLMKERVDELLEEIYGGSTETSFEVNTDNMLDAAKAEASLIAGNWSMVAKNGGISGYNKETGKFTFTEGTNGAVIDQDKLAADIVAAIAAKDYKAQIEAQVKEVEPELTAAQLEAKYTTIATYTTTATNNKGRNQNLKLATQAINGTIVNPGQEFSFNETTGPRSTEKGYQPASAYLNGEVVQEPGGGVCQVSSTLYNAVVFAGLKSTERHAHSYEPSYVTPGEDAAVSYGGPDFKFVNNSDYPIAIKASFSDQKVTCSVYGIPVLEEGVKVRMESEKTAELDPPAPTYEEDQTLQPNEEKTVKSATPGSRWSTALVTYKDGKEIERIDFHNSVYRGKAAIIKRNTSGVVVTTAPAQSEAATEPAAQTGGETAAASTEAAAGPDGPAAGGPSGEGEETQAAGSGQTPEGGEVQSPVENPVVPAAPGDDGSEED
ncbi:MAG: VanW family protein [Clostridium sp.]|nr:VanW family protein [Clostridium sp.]